MLLQCDFCGNACDGCLKIPCGYYIERERRVTYFVMPKNEDIYRNICLACMVDQSGKELTE